MIHAWQILINLPVLYQLTSQLVCTANTTHEFRIVMLPNTAFLRRDGALPVRTYFLGPLCFLITNQARLAVVAA